MACRSGPPKMPRRIRAMAHPPQPQVVVIDNLLSPDAPAELRRFRWGSTVWRTGYKDGYLGAFPEHGFAVPLLARIAGEFRTT